MTEISSTIAGSGGVNDALSSRAPVLWEDRVYTSYHSIFLTFIAISAASYSYLVGAALIGVGATRLGILGYLIGLVLGIGFVSLAGGSLSFRYGVDTVDAGKASLGTRGSAALLVGVLVCTLGWAYVLLAMTARASLHLFELGGAATHGVQADVEVIGVALGLLLAIWFVLKRGVLSMESVANYCAGAQLIIAVSLFTLIVVHYDATKAWMLQAPPSQAYSSDRMTQLTYAVEFGICNALGMLPYMGGLSRLVKHSRHLVGPAILGYAVCGAAFIAAVGALATAVTGELDPGVWILEIAGSTAGSLLLAVMLIANLGALVAQIYLAGIAAQQVRWVARLHWRLIVGLMLAPGVIVAFNTQWAIDHVMNWLAYNGVLFVGLASVLFVDFFFLRRERVVVAQLFEAQPGGLYWFWGGVNWIAVAVVGGSVALYLCLFDPVTLRAAPVFRYAGASIPTIAASCALYYTLMRWALRHRDLAGYRIVPVQSTDMKM